MYDYLIYKKCIDVVFSLFVRKNFMIMFGLVYFEFKMLMVWYWFNSKSGVNIYFKMY